MVLRRVHPVNDILDSLPSPEPSVRRGGDGRSTAIEQSQQGEGEESEKHCGGGHDSRAQRHTNEGEAKAQLAWVKGECCK